MFGWFKKTPPAPSAREVLAEVMAAVLGHEAAVRALALHDDPQALRDVLAAQDEVPPWENADSQPRDGEVAQTVFQALLKTEGLLVVIDWAASGQELAADLQAMLARLALPPLSASEQAAFAKASASSARGDALSDTWPQWQAVAQARGRQAVRQSTDEDAHHVLLLTPEAAERCRAARFARGLPVL